MHPLLTQTEKNLLLEIARLALIEIVNGRPPPASDLSALPTRLVQPGATFITLTKKGSLRGCIGTLTAELPLVEDVVVHVKSAAFRDYRFAPVLPEELEDIKIEISYLTEPDTLVYDSSDELLNLITPQRDGVIVMRGNRRATFLPQVWEKISDPGEFLSQLCLKMGEPADIWQQKKLLVQIYQVEKFEEK